MKKNMYKKVILVILAVLLVGCQQFGGGTQQGTEPRPQDYRTGTQGISMEFLPNLPPAQIITGNQRPFQAMLRIENQGTWNMPAESQYNTVYLSGFDTNIITFAELDAGRRGGQNSPAQQIGRLDGRGPFVPRGEFTTLSYQATINDLGSLGIDKYQPTILAIACYKYKTYASAQVCIDPDPYSAFSQQKVCTPGTVALGSQGAPIAVTQVETIPSPGRTRFVIHIQNVGGGHVFKDTTTAFNNCNPYQPGLKYDEIDQVRVSKITISGRDNVDLRATCKPSLARNDNHITLINGQATLHCETSDLTGNTAYLTPLAIELEYGYRQSISRQVELRSSNPAGSQAQRR